MKGGEGNGKKWSKIYHVQVESPYDDYYHYIYLKCTNKRKRKNVTQMNVDDNVVHISLLYDWPIIKRDVINYQPRFWKKKRFLIPNWTYSEHGIFINSWLERELLHSVSFSSFSMILDVGLPCTIGDWNTWGILKFYKNLL